MTQHTSHDQHASHDHTPHLVQRHCDVAVLGGAAAGLAAALQLGRQRRSVIVIDAGEPRNRPAAHVHGFLSREGATPSELLAAGRAEVRSYGGEVLAGRALDVTRTADGRFRVDLIGGHAVIARRVLVATGLVDELPAVDGLSRHWGRDVIHCPFCHGFEVRDRRIAVLVTHPIALHTVGLFRQLTTRLTVVLHDGLDVDPAELDTLRTAGVEVLAGRATRIVDDAQGRVAGLEFADRDRLDADVVAVGPRIRPRIEALATLGLKATEHPSGLGGFLETDATGLTAEPGVYAAGNVTDPSEQVIQATADGARIGAMISFSLADEDLQAAARPSANQVDWDHRYSGDQLWSGRPNGTLVHETSELTPGRALDVGAGEGGDALWLTEQGWQVTALDVSPRALDRIDAEATRRGVRLTCHRADANDLDAIEPGAFDLVSAQYASIPRTPDGRGVQNLINGVAPGGSLLVVSHDLAPLRAAVDTQTDSRAFDPDAYVRVEDFAAVLDGSPDWTIEVHQTRPRPPGAASASHHVDDVVLRARRRTG